MRDMLFVSHANPEDNEAARWLSLQLAREGYPVWCDLTKLLGGEDFWRDAEQAIRERTAKFLYVLSRVSNVKSGPIDELQVAKNVARELRLADFIVPLRFDDLPPRDANIRLTNLNMVPFQASWISGLAQLLKKLEEDGVAKDPRFTPRTVASWWRHYYRRERALRATREQLVSNWFQILDPVALQFHLLRSSEEHHPLQLPDDLPYPAVQYGEYLVSFAGAGDFSDHLGPTLSIIESEAIEISRTTEAARLLKWTGEQEYNALVRLLDLTWRRFLSGQKLPLCSFANHVVAMYFKAGTARGGRVLPPRRNGRQTYRQVVGFQTVRKATAETPAKLRHWHFALEARPLVHPFLGYAMKPHVVFSDDGEAIWGNVDLMHRARRSQCRNWWNDEWRDRILGTVSWLAGEAEFINLCVGSDRRLRLRALPMTVTSPVSYDNSDFQGPPVDEDEDEAVEDDIEPEEPRA